MLKLLMIGVIGVAATSGGVFVNLYLRQSAGDSHEETATHATIEQISTELTAVPVISKGKIDGYLVLKVSSTIDRGALKHDKLDVIPFLSDAAFRATFDYASKGVVEIKAKHIKELTAAISTQITVALGEGVVKSVNLEQFNFVTQDQVRGNQLKQQQESPG